MSGATVAYNLRRNKHVERQLFMEILSRLSRWLDLNRYLYIGFGGVYFEEFKLLHMRFGIEKMISLEQEEWMLPRQKLNVPYGCIEPIHLPSSKLVLNIDEYRAMDGVSNLLIWLDYVSPRDTPDQLTEIRSLIPKLASGDVLKVSLSLHTRWLDGGPSRNKLANRLENVLSKFGSAYLGEGVTVDDVTDEGIPSLYIRAFRRKVAEGLAENPELEFCPLGCYVYSDGTPMLTITGVFVDRQMREAYETDLSLKELDFISTDWEIHKIAVPDMSLRERLEIDQKLGGRSAEQIATELPFRFEEDPEESLELIRNYLKLYRYYPNYHRIYL